MIMKCVKTCLFPLESGGKELHGYVLIMCECAVGLICVNHNELTTNVKIVFLLA